MQEKQSVQELSVISPHPHTCTHTEEEEQFGSSLTVSHHTDHLLHGPIQRAAISPTPQKEEQFCNSCIVEVTFFR